MSITPLPSARTYTERGNAVVSRTAIDGGGVMFFEITVLRTWRQKHPTFQGTVLRRDGRWAAQGTTTGEPVELGLFDDYVDAENALVARRTRRMSAQKWTGPRPVKPYVPECHICGHELVNGACVRVRELHWTPETIAADAAERAARHAARGAARTNAD